MRPVPWWGLISSAAAPMLLIGGWTAAAARQPDSYDQVTDTISALAAHGATDRWLMTTALAGLGLCHAVTALALRTAGAPGRLLLLEGGVATVLVAALPLPSVAAHSRAHTIVAATAFIALAVWPAAAARRGDAPWALRTTAAFAASALLLGLVGWLTVELSGGLSGGDRVGLAERCAAGAQALWPLGVVLSARSWRTSEPPGSG